MTTQKLTSEQYKKLILQTLKDKYDLLVLGVAVMATIVVSIVEIAGTPAVANTFSGVKLPELPKINVTDTFKRSPQVTSAPENGEISAIQSEQRKQNVETYEVKIGDSLASIAQEVYGDYNAWTVIATANNLSSPDQIEIGMKLKIPR